MQGRSIFYRERVERECQIFIGNVHDMMRDINNFTKDKKVINVTQSESVGMNNDWCVTITIWYEERSEDE